MAKADDLLTLRKGLHEICTVPESIISVYSLEKHVWADSNSDAARRARKPELRTIEELQIDPVRPFLNDILRNMAAPWKPERKDSPVGQGYWIQAEFGSGKSHLVSFLAALALGDKQAWTIVADKEKKAGRGKRESLYRFWEEGIEGKSSKGSKGIFVVVKTLVGTGGGTVGVSDKGEPLAKYILDAVKEQLQAELGKNVSLFPVELLADRFLSHDLERYRNDLKKFLKDPQYFDEDEFEDLDGFIRDIQQNRSPEYKLSCGNKLWRFYDEYLRVQPQIAAETEDVLSHMVETVLAEGYRGILLVLDEVSLFMKNRDENQRTEDEKTLVVLSNRLAKVKNLPLWTVCTAQQAIESKMGVKNIIADDRLKQVKLLDNENDYYDIVLARVREIVEPAAVGNYYFHYKRGFSWPNSVGEDEFRRFFPFHKMAMEVLMGICYELTTARAGISILHQTLKHQIKSQGTELIRLWELFDESVRYEEDPSGVFFGLASIRDKKAVEYRAYEVCKRQIDGLTKGYLKVYRDRAVRTIQTLFLYHVARIRQQGLGPEEIANSVLIERSEDATVEENVQHYETLAENLKKELRQIAESRDEDGQPRYRFDPVFTGVVPQDEFRKARDEAETNQAQLAEAWEHLLALDEWPVRTRTMTVDLSAGAKSIFCDVAPFVGDWEERGSASFGDQTLEINWQGRQTAGLVGMRDLGRMASDGVPLPAIDSVETDLDFAAIVGRKPVERKTVKKLLSQRKDPRVVLWTPAPLTAEENDRLIDFAAYRRLVREWQGKDTEDAVAVINWVASSLQTEMGRIAKIVSSSYDRGRMDALNNTGMDFRVAGELASILTPIVDRVLSSCYVSKDIAFESPFLFRKEEGVKVINGIVKTGSIPKRAKPNQNTSAAQNFGFGLQVMKKSAEKRLDVTGNPYVQAISEFIEDKLPDEGQTMPMATLYKNFMGIGGTKDYGLTRRMVQIYALCLVREGKIRLTLGPKSGLPVNLLDYSNLAEVEFAAKTVDAITEVQRVAKPENWDVLRPYAEKLLAREIPPTHDDAEISRCRAELRHRFRAERETCSHTAEAARSLFEALEVANPYDADLNRVGALFAADIDPSNDIHSVLYALKEAFGYQAFDSNTVEQAEVDDLANRLHSYRALTSFVRHERKLRIACDYVNHPIPEGADFKGILREQRMLRKKLANIQPFIDSDVKLTTELVGHLPPEAGEAGTVGALIHEYTSVYANLHDSLLSEIQKARNAIDALLNGEDFRALTVLEKISALQPPVTGVLADQVAGLTERLFDCPSPSRNSVEEALRECPRHECDLALEDADEHRAAAQKTVADARRLLGDTLDEKLGVFLTPTVKQRLEQGKDDPVIQKILRARGLPGIRRTLTKAALDDAAIVKTINRYLKKISVVRVKLADFRPSVTTVEREQIPELAEEFAAHLEKALDEAEAGHEDVLPMLQIE